MAHISIRDLQKISGEAIGALAGPTPVKSGERTVGLLIPMKSADPDRLAAVLKRAAALARGRDAAAVDAALAAFGDVDPVDWSVAAVKALTRKPKDSPPSQAPAAETPEVGQAPKKADEPKPSSCGSPSARSICGTGRSSRRCRANGRRQRSGSCQGPSGAS